MKFIAGVAIVGMVCLVSCNKKGDDNILDPKTDYTFQNKTSKSIIVRVGDSLGENPFYLNIAPGHFVTIPNSRLVRNNYAVGLAYYWASTDFKMSSWYMTPIYYQIKTTGFAYYRPRYNYNISITPVRESMRMLYCLNGIDGTTQWLAVDAVNKSGQHVWDTLNNINKNHVVTLNYLQGATHDHSSTTGANIRDYFSFMFNDSTGRDVWLDSYIYNSADPAFNYPYTVSMTNDLTGWAPLSTTSIDTMYLMINGREPYYIMAKQH